jgi:two-component system LytT family response regulator
MTENRAGGANVTRIRALIVDDEPPARRKLRRFLRERPEIDIVGEAGDGPMAVALIESKQPDLVFLDIQMPEMDGFEVLSALRTDRVPHVVFVTAYDEHALRAFEVGALDYVLKPVDLDRFNTALDRAMEQLDRWSPSTPDTRLEEMLQALSSVRGYLERFLVRERGHVLVVRVGDVAWIEAAGNYVRLQTKTASFLVRGTLKALEKRLDPSKFARIHRSTIVNLDRVARFEPWSHGDLLVVMENGTELTLSRRFRRRMPGTFGGI